MSTKWIDPQSCPSLAVLVETVASPLLIQHKAAVYMEMDIPSGLPIPANPVLVAEMLGTLVSQALAEMPDGGDLNVMACETPNGLELEVADSGCDAEARAKSIPLAAAAIGAKLDWRNCAQGGASVTIAFPPKREAQRVAA